MKSLSRVCFLGPGRLQPARLLCPWNSPGKNSGVGRHSLLQEIIPTQGLNPGLLHCRQILYHMSHQGKPWLCQAFILPFPLLILFPLYVFRNSVLIYLIISYSSFSSVPILSAHYIIKNVVCVSFPLDWELLESRDNILFNICISTALIIISSYKWT